ncbi:MAG: hypothetical protein ABJA93_13420, partial [Sporichthyaceae bacterium]
AVQIKRIGHVCESEPEMLGLTHVPNARVRASASAVELMQNDEGPQTVEELRDVRVTKAVRGDSGADTCGAARVAYDPRGGVAVHPAPGSGSQQRPLVAVAAGGVEGAGHGDWQRDGGRLAALAEDLQDAVPALFTEVLDVDVAGLGDPQTEHAEQIGQRQSVGAQGVRGVQEGDEL